MATPKSSGLGRPPYSPSTSISVPDITDKTARQDGWRHSVAGSSGGDLPVSDDLDDNTVPTGMQSQQSPTLSAPPALEIPKRHHDPLGVNAPKKVTLAPPLSALAMARNIERLQDVEYPEGVRRPREDLNKSAKDGKFRYDRIFLMQFMPLCKEKPPNLVPLDALGIKPVDQSTLSVTHGGSGSYRQQASATTLTARQQSPLSSMILPLEAPSGSPGPPALKTDIPSMPPPLKAPRRRPGPLDITVAKKDMPTPLSSLRNIERLQDVEYPEGVRSPREDLNKGAKDGKFRYDREFLMQFMQLCKEKPPNLPPLDILGIEPVDRSTFSMTCRGSGRRPASAMMPTITGGFGAELGTPPGLFAMGQFSTPTSKLTSEERHLLSTGARSASVNSGPTALQLGLPGTAQGGSGAQPTGTNRVRSKRGDRRTGVKGPREESKFGAPGAVPVLGAVLELASPPEASTNRWATSSTTPELGATDTDFSKLVDHEVSALLDTLTMEKFDSISDQIIAWANKSKDGKTLIQVTRLVFEKAIDEAAWSEMYARLCRKMMETISSEVQDDKIRNAEGKPIAGGQLFRKYLLSRCQEDFERGWVAKETTAAAVKASDDQAVKVANEKKGDESELYSDEYYAAQRAKRRGLGLIKFTGELFKFQMLTERIMHEHVKKFLGNTEHPEEEEIESLCQLLKTVGQQLDVPKARAHMDVYFTRMKELCKSPNVSPRMQLMLQDVIELRDRKWAARGVVIAPTTISAVYEAAAKEKAAAEAQNLQRLSMSRGGSRRGGERNAESGPDGWTTAGGSVVRPQPKAGYLSQFGKISREAMAGGSVTQSQPKAGDLSQFGKISKAAPVVMGPSSVFTKKDKRDSLSRRSSGPNMFFMLSQNPESLQPKNPQLLPRTKPTSTEETSPPPPDDESEVPTQMSKADAKKKIDEDVKEFFAVRSMEEADVYFTNLPDEHRFRLVDKLVGSALESKEADAALVAEFFAQAASKGQCSCEIFEAGFMPMAELLDDVAIDAPNAFKFMAMMLKGAGLDKDEDRLTRLAGKSMDSDKLLQLVSP